MISVIITDYVILCACVCGNRIRRIGHGRWIGDGIRMTILLLALIVVGLYLLAMRGRTGHPGLGQLQGWSYAHRGLHNLAEGVPENSLEAFRLAAAHGYGSELDVHLLADGGLGVMHDSNRQRTTGCEGKMEDLTVAQLSNYHLQGTEQTIPTLQQVLETIDGKAPLIIELKTDENAAQLCETVCKLLDTYRGIFCLESFDPRCTIWLRKHRPDLIRGQLAENKLHDRDSKLPWIMRFVMAYDLSNFLGRPDFVAYDFGTRSNLSKFLCRKLWDIQGVSWTIRTREDFDTAVAEGWLPIFESIRP